METVQLPNGKLIEYIIDGQNRRVGKKVNGKLVQGFVYQSQTQVAAELDGQGKIVKQFVYGSKSNVPDYMIYKGKEYRIISDQVGTPKLVVEALSGKVVESLKMDEFGISNDLRSFETRDDHEDRKDHDDKVDLSIPFGFAGGLADHDTGFVRFGARDYDPSIGRWTTKDPIGFNGGDTNLYAYVGGNPVSYVDPLGLWGLQVGYNFSGFLGFGGAGLSGGFAIVGNGFNLSSITADVYQSSQFSAGVGASAGRGIQVSFTPNAQSLNDLSGRSVGGGVDTPVGGASVYKGACGNTYSVSGPSLGYSGYGGMANTNIGWPIKVTPPMTPMSGGMP